MADVVYTEADIASLHEELVNAHVETRKANEEIITKPTKVEPKVEIEDETQDNEPESEKEEKFDWDKDPELDSDDEDPKKPDTDDDADEELDQLEAAERWRVKRLNKVVNAKVAAEARAAQLEAELAELKGRQEAPKADHKISTENPIEDILAKDPLIVKLRSDISILKTKKSEYTAEEYADTIAELNRLLSKAETKIEVQWENQLNAQKSNEEQSIVKAQEDFLVKINKGKETYPKIENALIEIGKVASELHPDITKSFFQDANAADLVWAIGSKPKIIKYLIEASKAARANGSIPVDAIKFIGRLGLDVNSNKNEVIADNKAKVNAPINKLTPKAPISFKSRPSQSISEMDPWEFAKLRAAGKAKFPWEK